jgi:hypothetical protein
VDSEGAVLIGFLSFVASFVAASTDDGQLSYQE